MFQARTVLILETKGQGFYELTNRAREFVEEQDIEIGLLTVFLHHTSASSPDPGECGSDGSYRSLELFQAAGPGRRHPLSAQL